MARKTRKSTARQSKPKQPKPKPKRSKAVAGRTSPKTATSKKSPAPRPTTSKRDVLIQALSAPTGATNAALATLTGWQPHTVRAALTRLRQQGHAIERNVVDGSSRYRIVKP